MIGKRHAVSGETQMGYLPMTGKIHALQVELDYDGGATYDCSLPVMKLGIHEIVNSLNNLLI
jgi:xanthine dehydrogenase molybdopterin-binding subunit B